MVYKLICFMYIVALCVFFSDLCSGIRCALIIRWCLSIGQYCMVVVLGVSITLTHTHTHSHTHTQRFYSLRALSRHIFHSFAQFSVVNFLVQAHDRTSAACFADPGQSQRRFQTMFMQQEQCSYPYIYIYIYHDLIYVYMAGHAIINQWLS